MMQLQKGVKGVREQEIGLVLIELMHMIMDHEDK